MASGDFILPEPPPGTAFSTSSLTGVSTTETALLTVSNMLFAAGWAYEVKIRAAVYGTAGLQCLFRLRKGVVGGTDWGEYGRARCEGTSAGNAAMANGSIILLRSAATDLTVNVVLTGTASSSTLNVFASSASPRYLLIKPIGLASDYAGLGVDVT